MRKDDLVFFYNFFDSHVKSFYSDDEFVQQNIILKEEHTRCVCREANMICGFLGLDDEKRYLVETSALFHDIGRFTQFARYKTFNDAASENHALLGVEVLKKTKILSRLLPEEHELILKAVELHNVYKIPEGLSEEELLFVKIVRDADKLDIFRVVTDYYAERFARPNPVMENYLPESLEYSMEIIDDIMNNRNSETKYIRTANDLRLFKLTWIFDVNFPVTLKAIKDKKYVEKTVAALPDTRDIKMVFQHLIDYLNTAY